MQRRDFVTLLLLACLPILPRSMRSAYLKESYDLTEEKSFQLPLKPYDGQTLILNLNSVSSDHEVIVTCHLDQSIESRTCDLTIDVPGSYAFIYSTEGRFWALEVLRPELQINSADSQVGPFLKS